MSVSAFIYSPFGDDRGLVIPKWLDDDGALPRAQTSAAEAFNSPLTTELIDCLADEFLARGDSQGPFNKTYLTQSRNRQVLRKKKRWMYVKKVLGRGGPTHPAEQAGEGSITRQ